MKYQSVARVLIVAQCVLILSIVMGCSTKRIVGSIESYNRLALRGFPIQLSLRVDNPDYPTFVDIVARVDKDGQFEARVDVPIAAIRDIDIRPSPDWYVWQHGADSTRILKNPIIVVGFDWTKYNGSSIVNLGQVTMFNAIKIKNLGVDRVSSLDELIFVWDDDIPDVDFYSIRLSRIDDQNSGFAVVGLRHKSFVGRDLSTLPEWDTAKDLAAAVLSGPVITMKPNMSPGRYVITIRAYRFEDSNERYVTVGHSKFELPGDTLEWVEASP